MTVNKRTKVVLLFWLLGILVLAGCGKKQETDYYEVGMEQLTGGSYEDAIASFQSAIEADWRLAESYRGLGIASMNIEDYPTAITSFQRSLNNMDSKNEAFEKDVQYYLASVRYAYGEREEAVAIYTEIINKYHDIDCYFLRGKAKLALLDYDGAKADFDVTLKDSSDYDLYINVYQVFVDANMEADGDAYLEKALDIEVESSQDYFNRGRIYYCLREYDNAKTDLTTAADGGYQDAYLLLGKVYLSMNDVDNARMMYEDYQVQYGESAQAYNGLALCDMALSNYESALANVQKGIALNDAAGNQSLLYNEIVCYEYLLDFNTAKDKMTQYLQKYPTDEAAIRENKFLQSR